MRRVVLLAAVGLLALAGVADAAHPTLADSQRIAAAAFPGPCGPTLDITFADRLDERDSDGLATGRQLVDGGWVTVACKIAVKTGLGAARTCDVIVHERGHLAGIEHSEYGVMSVNGGDGWPACHPPLTRREEAFELVFEILPRRLVWTVNCNPKVTRCVARAPGAKYDRRFEVDAEVTVSTLASRKADRKAA